MSRTFTTEQRDYMWEAQQGRCTWCGRELGTDTPDGDHRERYSEGGPTETWNGQLLHQSCHREKTRLLDRLRRWQREFVLALDRHQEKAFLLKAPVGAGKTRAGVAAFQMWKRRHPNGICVVIAPSVQIIRGWASEAIQYGQVGVKALDASERKIWSAAKPPEERELLRVDRTPPSTLEYWLATYQSLNANLLKNLRILCAQRPVFVILDEIHHASQEKEGAWGEAVAHAFEHAQLVLCNSATPSRTDGQRIAWLTYDEDGYAIPHYELEWWRAVDERLIVAAEFVGCDAEAKWRRITADDVIADSGSISDEGKGNVALAVAINDVEYQDKLIAEGAKALEYKRRQFREATGLILASGRIMAQQIAKRLNDRRAGSAEVATGDLPEAHRTIDKFRNRDIQADWLVAVGMVSEGCDIPHVKTIVWLNNTRTTNDFIQRVGRGVRSVGTDVTLTVVLPDHPELQRMAVDLLNLQGSPLDERERETGEGPSQDPSTLFGDGVENARPTWYTRHDETGANPVDEEAVRVATRIQVPVDVIQEVLAAQRLGADDAQRTEPTKDPNRPLLEMRTACNAKVRKIALTAFEPAWQNQYQSIWTRAHYEARIPRTAKGPLRSLESFSLDELQRLHGALCRMEKDLCP